MGSIPPISGFSDDDALIYGTIMRRDAATTPQITGASSSPEGVNPDAAQSDNTDNLKALNYTLYKARTFFNNGQYQAAQELYQEFFRYLKVYRADSFYSNPIDITPALFESAWAMEQLGQQKEALMFLNSELLRLMEPIIKPTQTQNSEIRKEIKGLQDQGLFPSQFSPAVKVSTEQLTLLAQALSTAGQRPIAIDILGQVQVRSLLESYRAQLQSNRWQQEEKFTIPPDMNHLLPETYSHLGLPISPVLPITAEDARKIQSQMIQAEYHLDKVDPVDAIGSNSRGGSQRKRRQRKQGASLTKGKSPRGRRKPRITL